MAGWHFANHVEQEGVKEEFENDLLPQKDRRPECIILGGIRSEYTTTTTSISLL